MKLTEQQIEDLFKGAPEGYNYYTPNTEDWYEAWFMVKDGIAIKTMCINDRLVTHCTYNLYHLLEDGAIKRPEPKEEIKKETNMIYTQEMHGNGELPSVGMRVIYNHCNPNKAEYKLKYHNNEVTIVAIVKGLFVLLSDDYGFTTVCNNEWIKPLPPVKTKLELAKEKQVIDVADFLRKDNYLTYEEMVKHLQEKGMLAEIELSKTIDIQPQEETPLKDRIKQNREDTLLSLSKLTTKLL